MMGKYRDHREPRRRGFEDDRSNDQESVPSYFQRQDQQRQTALDSHPVDVEVVWFNAGKGFGFVKLADGSEAFLHIRALETAGVDVVSEGTHLTVRIGQGQKGLQVTEVLEARRTTPKPSGNAGGDPNENAQRDEHRGTVKWFNAEKGFGFIALEGGGKDVFVHASVLKRAGIEALVEGQKVIVRCAQGQKGAEVSTITVA